MTSDEVLTDADRCDRCGSRAYLRATLPNGEALHFCAHHGAKFMPTLAKLATEIVDETHQLNAISHHLS